MSREERPWRSEGCSVKEERQAVDLRRDSRLETTGQGDMEGEIGGWRMMTGSGLMMDGGWLAVFECAKDRGGRGEVRGGGKALDVDGGSFTACR